ncbi:MAG TPA: hypothetical protein VIM69_00410 [Opitutaceae bacterium]
MINDAPADYTVTFSIQPPASMVTATVSLIEEATGTNTGGVFSWSDFTFQPGQTSASVTLHLGCDTAGVFGGDGPPFYPLCDNSSHVCTNRTPCSCRQQDAVTVNDPQSHLGGHDLLGDHPAKVHAEIIVSPGNNNSPGPVLGSSNTLQIMCSQKV